ncbi:MAG: hypothetical protein V4475_01740 [Pseudomonadota bacterium]
MVDDISTRSPTTLEGIKRLAKQIKRRDDCRHAIALNSAAAQAGFANFPDAHRKLGNIREQAHG